MSIASHLEAACERLSAIHGEDFVNFHVAVVQQKTLLRFVEHPTVRHLLAENSALLGAIFAHQCGKDGEAIMTVVRALEVAVKADVEAMKLREGEARTEAALPSVEAEAKAIIAAAKKP